MSALHSPEIETETETVDMAAIGVRARAASEALAVASSDAKNAALMAAAVEIRNDRTSILAANAEDMAAARAARLSDAMMDRLALDETRIEAMATGQEDISRLDDPIGVVIAEWDRPNGLAIQRVRVHVLHASIRLSLDECLHVWRLQNRVDHLGA